MAVFFSSTELIDIAVGIEKSGAAFYDVLANSAGDKKAREAYKYLADNEREHIKIFQNMNAGAGEYPSPESYTEEYADYLDTLVDSAVFVNDKAARKMARQVANMRPLKSVSEPKRTRSFSTQRYETSFAGQTAS